jgi:hypothetical protein
LGFPLRSEWEAIIGVGRPDGEMQRAWDNNFYRSLFDVLPSHFPEAVAFAPFPSYTDWSGIQEALAERRGNPEGADLDADLWEHEKKEFEQHVELRFGLADIYPSAGLADV